MPSSSSSASSSSSSSDEEGEGEGRCAGRRGEEGEGGADRDRLEEEKRDRRRQRKAEKSERRKREKKDRKAEKKERKAERKERKREKKEGKREKKERKREDKKRRRDREPEDGTIGPSPAKRLVGPGRLEISEPGGGLPLLPRDYAPPAAAMYSGAVIHPRQGLLKPPAGRGGGAGGKGSYESQQFRCAVCRVDCSGEQSFAQHCAGRAHASKAGRKGFAGLLPNNAGIIPPLSIGGVFAFQHGNEGPQWTAKHATDPAAAAAASTAPLMRVGLSGDDERMVRSALQKSASSGGLDRVESGSDLRDRLGDGGARGGGGRGRGQGGGHSRPAFAPPPPAGAPLRSTRERLPAFGAREEILGHLRSRDVVIIEGDTGCGKSTQVPQYILEEAAECRAPCSIIVAQPRRIAAMGVAERVAEERGEVLGGTVGYSVRHDSRASSDTALLFATTGVLVRRLESEPTLPGITHVVIDEVHERTVEIDLVLMVLRDLVARRGEGGPEGGLPPLKLILMSATLDASLLGPYLGAGTPTVRVPGRTFPVRTLYLEDALALTSHVVDPRAQWAKGMSGRPGGGGGGGGGVCHDFLAGRCSRGEQCKFEHPSGGGAPGARAPGTPLEHSPDSALSEGELERRYGEYPRQVVASIAAGDADAVNYDLLADLVGFFCKLDRDKGRGPEGGNGGREDDRSRDRDRNSDSADAILVFLSGAKEIERAADALASRGPRGQLHVLPLHGGLPPEEQRRVFRRPPPGTRKVVLATNVAETSITVDDVGFVIDTGRVKENRYDSGRQLQSLEDVLVSQAAAKQRRGRAGRVAPGVAVHLFTRHRHDVVADKHTTPEVRRVPLEALVLRLHSVRSILRIGPGGAAEACARLMEPPGRAAVLRAVGELEGIGALERAGPAGAESLTPLGVHLAALPVDPRIGKLTLLGAVFGVLDEALTIAAAISSRSPFMSPPDQREAADAARRELAAASGFASDHLTLLHAYNCFEAERGEAKYAWARRHFLGVKTLQQMGATKRQLLELLSDAGYAPSGLSARRIESAGRAAGGTDGCREALGQRAPAAGAAGLLPALLCAALYPRVASVQHAPQGKKGRGKSGGGGGGQAPKLFVRDPESGDPTPVAIHPSSVNARVTRFPHSYLVYHELVKTTKLYLRDTTPVPPLALLLLGAGSPEVDEREGDLNRPGGRGDDVTVCLGGWIKMRVPRRVLGLLMEARGRVEEVLRRKAERPGERLFEGAWEIVEAVSRLVALEEGAAGEGGEGGGGGGGGGRGGGGGGGGRGGGGGGGGGGGRKKKGGRGGFGGGGIGGGFGGFDDSSMGDW